MQQFEQTRTAQTDEVVETLHHSVADHQIAEELVDAIAATDAFAEATGYSDGLFCSFLKDTLSDGLVLAGHRVDGAVTRIYEAPDHEIDETTEAQFIAAFPVNPEGVAQLFGVSYPIVKTVRLGAYLVYQFIYAPTATTFVVIRRGIELLSPVFEASAEDILDEKWKHNSATA